MRRRFSPEPQNAPSSASIRAFRSLRPSHLAQAVSAQHLLPVAWTIEPHEDCNGNLMIVVLPDLDIPTAPSFVLDGEDGAVKLGMVTEDTFKDLGKFKTICGAMLQIALVSAARPERRR